MALSPKVSIQIPTYNQQKYIVNTIESVLMQDYDNIEIVVSDDNSTDRTAEVLAKYKNNPKIKYFKNNLNIGRVDNYHKALYEYCTGDWVLNLDGDDYFTDISFIKNAVELIMENGDKEVVVFQANHNLEQIKKIFPHNSTVGNNAVILNGQDYFKNFYRVRSFTHCATIFDRKKALKLNFYSFNCLFSDFNSMSKLFLMGKIIISGKNVAIWRIHEGNESSGLNEKNLYKELESIDDIAKFATEILVRKVVKQWQKRIKNYLVFTCIGLLLERPKKKSSFLFILKHFKWDYIYLKQVIKYIIK